MEASDEEIDVALGLSLQEEIIKLYEGGETVAGVVAELRSRGIPTSSRSVNKILDAYQIPRHLKLSNWQGRSARDKKAKEREEARQAKEAEEALWRSGGFKLSRKQLARIAERHRAGQGVAISRLAESARVTAKSLRQELQAAGHVVSTRAEWTNQELERLKEEIVRMYRDEEENTESIVERLRERDVFVGSGRVRALLVREGVSLRQPMPALRPRSGTPSSPREASAPAVKPLRELIEEHGEELARRFLDDGETIREIAEDLGVDHIQLSGALKKAGHLPFMNLSRINRKK